MSFAIDMKASSTFIDVLALVSMNFILYSTANAWPLSVDTWRLSFISHLFPNIIFSTSAAACYEGDTKSYWQTQVTSAKQELDSIPAKIVISIKCFSFRYTQHKIKQLC